MNHIIILLSFLLSSEAHKLRGIGCLTANVTGAGMNGGFGGIVTFGGGRLKMKICKQTSCCVIERLNNEDDNWREGNFDIFMGRQLMDCENFDISTNESSLTLTLEHSGSDDLYLNSVELYGSGLRHSSFYHKCSIRVGLNPLFSSYTTPCSLVVKESNGKECNGHSKFCSISFESFTFPGSHNAGTGQSEGLSLLNCAFKNHDLNVKEQLDFGLRVFDLDVILSTRLPNCHGLETGHGKYLWLSLYYCFGSLRVLLNDVKDWMREYEREIVVLYFGHIDYPSLTKESLEKELLFIFPNQINVHYQRHFPYWPTLQEAIDENQRLFVFIRETDTATTVREEFIREIQISHESGFKIPKLEKGSVSILSTFTRGGAGNNCANIIESVNCTGNVNLIKLSVFATFTGSQCLHSIAPLCNARVSEALQKCGKPVNFIIVDYPTYLRDSRENVVDIAYKLNLQFGAV